MPHVNGINASIAARLHVRDDAYAPVDEAGCIEISTISEKKKVKSFHGRHSTGEALRWLANSYVGARH
jgi:hypothetical protein